MGGPGHPLERAVRGDRWKPLRGVTGRPTRRVRGVRQQIFQRCDILARKGRAEKFIVKPVKLPSEEIAT
eukprot:6874317-Prymnesium_polylepis.1